MEKHALISNIETIRRHSPEITEGIKFFAELPHLVSGIIINYGVHTTEERWLFGDIYEELCLDYFEDKV